MPIVEAIIIAMLAQHILASVAQCLSTKIHLSIAQQVIIQSIANEGIKFAEILIRYQAQFESATLSRTQVFDLAKKFRSGHDVWRFRRIQVIMSSAVQHQC